MKSEIVPVIHMIDEYQVNKNIETCISCGINKVFIINHYGYSEDLIQCSIKAKENYKNLWVGVNMLDKTTIESLSSEMEVDGLWCDKEISAKDAKTFRKFKGMFFGSLAFKYQKQPKNLKEACEEAIVATDVATTSGDATGKSADVEKIKNIYEFLKGHPMAIASGISASNVRNYNKLANYLLVASSITDINEMIIKEKLVELIEENNS